MQIGEVVTRPHRRAVAELLPHVPLPEIRRLLHVHVAIHYSKAVYCHVTSHLGSGSAIIRSQDPEASYDDTRARGARHLSGRFEERIGRLDRDFFMEVWCSSESRRSPAYRISPFPADGQKHLPIWSTFWHFLT